MSETAASLRHKIDSADELESVVRTMKAMAASNIGQYENAVGSLADYYRTVQLGLAACLRQSAVTLADHSGKGAIGAVVFGSDQGLVGRFNEVMVDYVINTLEKLPGKKVVWAVGERIQARFADTDMRSSENFTLPNSINAITSLVGQILTALEEQREHGQIEQIYLFYNRPENAAVYTPVNQRLLPLDEQWQHDLAAIPWPSKNLPEVMDDSVSTLQALIREYLFVSLFRACAESLASENASRLTAMQRAEKNIDELQEDLHRDFHRLRQSDIDEELFDVISGFEALKK